MKIINLKNQLIPACLVIPCNGFEISISTILPPASLLVSDMNGDAINSYIFNSCNVYPSAENIQKAISYCTEN